MSFSTITAAQRLEIRDSAVQVASVTQPFAQNGLAPTAAELALITPVLSNCAAALGVAGATGLPATQAIVANGNTVAVRNSAGAASHNGTAVVAGGAVTGVNLAATVAMVDSGTAITVPVTGTYATKITPTVVAGVITGFVLS